MICLWVNKRDWKHPGPILAVGLRNAQSLATVGLETHLCCGEGSTSNTEADLGQFYGMPPHDGLHIHRHRRLPISGSTSIFFRAFALARQLARRDRVAVLTREPGFLPFLALLCRDKRIRGLYEAHNFLADLSWRKTKPGWAERRDGWLERFFLPKVSGLVAITRRQGELYGDLFPRLPICALPLGARPGNITAEDLERRRCLRTLVYVGHLHGFKGVANLLVFARKGSRKAGVRLLFVGGASAQLERFKARVTSPQMADVVTFKPFVPPGELDAILHNEASAGAVLLEDTFYNRNLTCPAKALDYISHGLPVFATDLPSNRDVLGNAAFYIKARKELVKILVTLLGSPEAYATASRAALERARELSWENRARRLADFIQARFDGREVA
mgnify:CR=1 FL=1